MLHVSMHPENRQLNKVNKASGASYNIISASPAAEQTCGKYLGNSCKDISQIKPDRLHSDAHQVITSVQGKVAKY